MNGVLCTGIGMLLAMSGVTDECCDEGCQIELRLPTVIWNAPAKCAPAPCAKAACEARRADAGDEQVVTDILSLWQRSGVTAQGGDPNAFAAELRRLHARHAEKVKPERQVATAQIAPGTAEQGLHGVDALRGGATELEGLADRFERYGLYERADELRKQAELMRLDAREMLHGDRAIRKAAPVRVSQRIRILPKWVIEAARVHQPESDDAVKSEYPE